MKGRNKIYRENWRENVFRILEAGLLRSIELNLQSTILVYCYLLMKHSARKVHL